MPIQSSFAQVASQIVAFNRNIVETLSKINSLSTTTDPSVNVDIIDIEGVSRSYSLPSFTFLKTEIERLNNSINSLYSIEAPGAMIQTSNANKFRKIITVDLNREPGSIDNLGVVTEFKSDRNWFFDGLLNPQLMIELDLGDKIENNVRKILTRRYIVEFAKNQDGTLTNLGQSALNSFNTLYRGKSSVDIAEFENWHRSTPGLINPLSPNYDEQTFDLLPNVLLYDGVFNVLRIEEDALNRKLWYHVNTLNYVVNETLQLRQLSVGDELIINQVTSSTRYTIVEISKSESNNRLRLERVEGLQPIPVGVGSLKIYSPVVYRKRVRISVGYNERNVLFVKPVNADLNLVAKDWSKGTGFYTNDLKLSSNTPENGYTMDQYYFEFVYDYGEVLQDLVQKKVPNKLAGVPNVVNLSGSNFKVVQINRHLTDSPDANLLLNKNNYANTLRNEITQIEASITDRKNKLKVLKFADTASRREKEQEVTNLENQKVSKSNLLSTLNQEILSLSKSPSTNVEPVFRLRGFWSFPEPVTSLSSRDNSGNNTIILPQEVVQFRVQYRYISKDGREPQIETFNVATNPGGNSQTTAAFSNWNEYKTDVRKRIFDENTQTYFWQIEDIESADTPNINQIDITINANEQVEIRMKSISEVGWPESPVESDWSEILTVAFPDDLNNVLNDNDFILQEASREELRLTMNNALDAIGLREHLSDASSTTDQVFYHSSEKILSGFRDDNGIVLSLLEYLTKLENRIQTLEEKITRVKGELEVIVMRLTEEFAIGNNSETGFFVELEDYLNLFIEDGASRNRRYINRIYTVGDFNLKIRNRSIESPLGLLSNRTYTPSSIYNSLAPQVFWVNPNNELLFTDVSGTTKTQLDNQFIWCVNYDTITQQNTSKLSENMGNSFVALNSNSLTDKLSLTEYNLGYAESTPLAFVSSNNSLSDSSKWIDPLSSESSTNKLLSTVHPVISSFESIVEGNEDKVKVLSSSRSTGNSIQYSEINIPIRIYFKMNALNENTKNGSYIDLENAQTTIQHIKKLKFFLENESDNRPFTFTLKFTLNRNRVVSESRSRNQVVFNSANDVKN
jgi:hypothetical protein